MAVNENSGDISVSANNFLVDSIKKKYSYNFNWLGRPIIQYPQDIVVMQELIWQIKPDLIIETGIAHGGSLIFSASMLAILDYYLLILSIIRYCIEYYYITSCSHPICVVLHFYRISRSPPGSLYFASQADVISLAVD